MRLLSSSITHKKINIRPNLCPSIQKEFHKKTILTTQNSPLVEGYASD